MRTKRSRKISRSAGCVARTGAAGKLLLLAAELGESDDIKAVTDALLAAVEREGWMERLPFPALSRPPSTGGASTAVRPDCGAPDPQSPEPGNE
jgi:hypothetical protein